MVTQENSSIIADVSPVSRTILNYKYESYIAKQERMKLNALNWDVYHLRQDYSHKRKGQSREFLAKQSIAVEQLVSFLQQSLTDLGDWFRIDPTPGNKNTIFTPDVQKSLLARHLEYNSFPTLFSDLLKLGALGSLMICKVGGQYVQKVEYETKPAPRPLRLLGSRQDKLFRKTRNKWQLLLAPVRQEDYFPDPNPNPTTGKPLYEVQQIEMDFHDLIKTAQDNPEEWDMDEVHKLKSYIDQLQRHRRARETNQIATYGMFRKRVTLLEVWGTIIDSTTGHILMENAVCTISSFGHLLRPPMPNPLWHNESPFIVGSILRVPFSVWHKALMDAPTRHNIAINELYNLMFDGGMMDVFGIKQLKDFYLEDPSQVSDGIAPGETLLVNSSCPPGEKVLERIDTAALSQSAFSLFSLVDREFQQSSLTNDTRMGSVASRDVKATEVVASQQAITGVFNGIVKIIEEQFVEKMLSKAWLTCAQHMNDLDHDDVVALFGDQKAAQLSSLTPEARFAQSAAGHKFKVFGLSTTLNKLQDFRKITTLLQSIGTSNVLMAEFQQKYSFAKLLGEIMDSLDIDKEKIEASPDEIQGANARMQQIMQMQTGSQGGTPGSAGPTSESGANMQSQIPQEAAARGFPGKPNPRAIINQGSGPA